MQIDPQRFYRLKELESFFSYTTLRRYIKARKFNYYRSGESGWVTVKGCDFIAFLEKCKHTAAE